MITLGRTKALLLLGMAMMWSGCGVEGNGGYVYLEAPPTLPVMGSRNESAQKVHQINGHWLASVSVSDSWALKGEITISKYYGDPDPSRGLVTFDFQHSDGAVVKCSVWSPDRIIKEENVETCLGVMFFGEPSWSPSELFRKYGNDLNFSRAMAQLPPGDPVKDEERSLSKREQEICVLACLAETYFLQSVPARLTTGNLEVFIASSKRQDGVLVYLWLYSPNWEHTATIVLRSVKGMSEQELVDFAVDLVTDMDINGINSGRLFNPDDSVIVNEEKAVTGNGNRPDSIIRKGSDVVSGLERISRGDSCLHVISVLGSPTYEREMMAKERSISKGRVLYYVVLQHESGNLNAKSDSYAAIYFDEKGNVIEILKNNID